MLTSSGARRQCSAQAQDYLGRVIHEIAAAMCCSDSWFKVFTTGQKRGVTS